MEDESALKTDIWENMADPRAKAKNSSDCHYFWLGWHSDPHHLFNSLLITNLSASWQAAPPINQKKDAWYRWIFFQAPGIIQKKWKSFDYYKCCWGLGGVERTKIYATDCLGVKKECGNHFSEDQIWEGTASLVPRMENPRLFGHHSKARNASRDKPRGSRW